MQCEQDSLTSEANVTGGVKPIAHLVWQQGRPAIDDAVDYYEVARPGDKSVDGTDPFPVWDQPKEFLHRLIENAFSWALEDCNYLNPKYMDRLIAATEGGMKPEEAAVWNATEKEQAARRAAIASTTAMGDALSGVSVSTERDIYEVANQLGGYVDPGTPPHLARFLIREAEEASKLASEIVRLRALSVPQVRVKQLVWLASTMTAAVEGEEKPAAHYWTARHHVVGFMRGWEISQFVDERFPKVSRRFTMHIRGVATEFDTLDEAKAAAQSDYEESVISAIEPDTGFTK